MHAQSSFMLGREPVLLNFRRNVQLNIIFCNTVNQEGLKSGPAAFDSFINLVQKGEY